MKKAPEFARDQDRSVLKRFRKIRIAEFVPQAQPGSIPDERRRAAG
jgi:hypothetical protein